MSLKKLCHSKTGIKFLCCTYKELWPGNKISYFSNTWFGSKIFSFLKYLEIPLKTHYLANIYSHQVIIDSSLNPSKWHWYQKKCSNLSQKPRSVCTVKRLEARTADSFLVQCNINLNRNWKINGKAIDTKENRINISLIGMKGKNVCHFTHLGHFTLA